MIWAQLCYPKARRAAPLPPSRAAALSPGTGLVLGTRCTGTHVTVCWIPGLLLKRAPSSCARLCAHTDTCLQHFKKVKSEQYLPRGRPTPSTAALQPAAWCSASSCHPHPTFPCPAPRTAQGWEHRLPLHSGNPHGEPGSVPLDYSSRRAPHQPPRRAPCRHCFSMETLGSRCLLALSPPCPKIQPRVLFKTTSRCFCKARKSWF